ncbi:ferredoxin--NADP reductase [Skermanella sp. TT6]|uniref:ferredoxin--NADP(+) reductase n=1 Tax=Skermanella cutis TaxID=2775420 RepID=A0ABX7BG57_9PROT|nr:ferredoxin--NADP reductase [Skermanella sp. TT6]QQP92056.1 ferredoxin--NADP reductase [Skermanella sp. TT6]
MSNILRETVLEVHHWTDSLFSLKTTRDPGFRFDSGEFAMMGLEVDGRPLLRAYSVVSSPYEEQLEFLSIKVPNGPLTSRLQHVKPGDTILINRKATGTLLLHNLLPGKTLWLLSTGTGLAPFLSIAKDPTVYDRFDRVVLTHTVRHKAELECGEAALDALRENEYIGELATEKLVYYPTVTREPFRNEGRITDLLRSGKVYKDLGLTPLDPAGDRVMICGNPHMTSELTQYMEELGFEMGANNKPGTFVIEKAFAQR